ncbi:response regulator [Methylocystis sp. IM3]|uniref:response regulator n=1 Tax=unclassified Methylocystis TaxID=2625913 RepID=UPI000FA1A5D9|nr:MAG: response regulator [Hyphomicrobiales bacterium]
MKEVLVVDDSSVIRKVARRILEGLHMRTSEAADARSALVACEKRMPDGILLDWNMPEMGGVEFLIALRQMPGGAAPKVVFCTSENDAGHIARAMRAGADEYMLKPFDQNLLKAKFEEIGLV